ncbi:MAG: nucleotidyltransferase domain-containing protein [candidate division Zixibacteria bacterium]|nr:nucleotidyltransferase domain-containing protein [candidate division Zixibacteria bacterium]
MAARKRKSKLGYLTPREKKAVLAFVDDVKKELGDDLVAIKLFGSKARGDHHRDSDVDILIVMRIKNLKKQDKIFEILVDVELATDTILSPIVYYLRQYQRSRKLGSPFIETVEEEGIPL